MEVGGGGVDYIDLGLERPTRRSVADLHNIKCSA